MMGVKARVLIARKRILAIFGFALLVILQILPNIALANSTQYAEASDSADLDKSASILEVELQRLLLTDLVEAYENPSQRVDERINGELFMMRILNAQDYEVSRAIVDNWTNVYSNPNYELFVFKGGDIAEELADAGIPDNGRHAFVVLGKALQDGEMTDELKGRCDAALAASRSFPNAVLICTGGATGENNPEGNTEAGLMYAYMVDECGLDKSRVFIDERALSTLENARNALEMLIEQDIHTMTIITSTYHQRRAQAVFNAEAVLMSRQLQYSITSIGNYCFGDDSSNAAKSGDDRVAIRQIAQILELPEEQIELLPSVEE